MAQPGKLNLITDVEGLSVGHATDESVKTGVTVLRCAESYVTAVDVRGGAPGVRETETLSPENLVRHTDAIVLTGGSVFGLAAADGVSNTLSQKGIGLRLSDSGPAIPIVPAAVLHDLSNDGDKEWGANPPYHALGIKACESANKEFALGSVGAGRGAMAGVKKGGLGSSSLVQDQGSAEKITIGALVAANPVGSVFMPDGKTFYAWPWEQGDEFGARAFPESRDVADPFPDYSRLGARTQPGANTTLAIVATSADLTPEEAKRVAMMAHDGIARAIRPAHTSFDGDITFAIATAKTPLPTATPTLRAGLVSAIGAAAADCLARAIARAVYHAEA